MSHKDIYYARKPPQRQPDPPGVNPYNVDAEAAVAKYWNALRHITFKTVAANQVPIDDWDSVFATVLYSLALHGPKYDPALGSKFLGFLYAFVYKASISNYRRNDLRWFSHYPMDRSPNGHPVGPRQEPPAQFRDGLFPRDPKPNRRDDQVLQRMIVREQAALVRAAMRSELNRRQRVVVYLRVVRGWRLKEVAPLLKVTSERVRQIEQQAIEKLRLHLGVIEVRQRGKPWTDAQDKLIFTKGVSDAQAALQIGRTVLAVRTRRDRLRNERRQLELAESRKAVA